MKTKKIIKLLRADGDPTRLLATEAANRLEMLSVDLKKLHAKLAAMKAERDAMLADLKREHKCSSCKHNDNTEHPECMITECEFCENCHCYACVDGDQWEWRGAKDTNVPTKEDQP